VGKSDGRRPLERPRRRWVVNNKMDLRKIGWDCMHWIDLDEDRDQWRALLKTVINLRVQKSVGKFLSSCRFGFSSRRAQLHR
jgi:hypothetical protein